MLIKAVLFDFDGTLTEPGSLDFGAIRRAVSCPQGRPVLEFIEGISSEEEQATAFRILHEAESEAALRSRPNRGAEDLLEFLFSHGLKVGILSRNSLASIETALGNFHRFRTSDFAVILSRDDPFSPKPSPEGIHAAAEAMEVPVGNVLVVGDFVFDVMAGHEAGAITAWLSNRGASHPCTYETDFRIEQLGELEEIIRLHSELPPGKLPNDLLGRFLEENRSEDPSILIHPGVGEDVAAVRNPGGGTLVLKSDPITFAADSIGIYAVTVGANDVAAAGAVPHWLLTALLLPQGTTAAEIRALIGVLSREAARQGMALCGGHTEITDAVRRPVVVSQIVGTAPAAGLVDKRNMRAGNRILLTKGVAVEGTALIARDFSPALERRGMPAAEIEKCRRFLLDPGISIVKEARIAAESGAATAMHDVTEGGLATALEELSAAGGHRIRVYAGRIPVFEETRNVCRLLGIDPLGLIGSGSLLIACRVDAADALVQSLKHAGVRAFMIGEVLGEGEGIEALDHEGGNDFPWPRFATDEITRVSRLAPDKGESS